MLQNTHYTKDLQVKITKLYEDPTYLSKVLSSNNTIYPIKKYSNLFESVDMESDEDDIYEVLDNDLAHIENEEEIKRYLTVNPNLWMKARAKREEASEMLHNKQAGQFIVRESSQEDTFALSIRVPDNLSKPVNHYLLLKSDLGFEAQGSNLYFPTLPSLLAHFCSYQSGGMPCLLRPPKKKADKCSHIQGYFPPPGSGEEGENEIFFNPRGRGIAHAPILRQTHSVPVQTNMNPKTPRILPPPPATCLRPITTSKVHITMPAQPSHSPSNRHPAHLSHPIQNVLPSNDLKHRPYMDPCHQRSITPELDEVPIDYASVEYDTPPDSNIREPIPMLPPRTYLNQTEVEYAGHIVSPDMNEYDEPGEILRNSIPIHRVRTTEESHSSHAHGFLPPPIPPKTASMLIETKRLGATPPMLDDEDALDSSQEVKSGILHNCIRPKEPPPMSKFIPIQQSNRDSDVYLDMDPRETSSEIEKDIELQVHHTIKHQNGSNYEESSAAYVNVMFNTIATFKRIKQLEEPFEIGFQSTQGKLYPDKSNSPVSHFNSNSYDPKMKEHHYNRFTPANKLSGLSAMPPITPLSPLRLKHDPVISRKYALGERMAQRPSHDDIFNKPLPSPRNSIDHDILNNLRRSNSADLLETPNRKLDKPPLLPKPKLFSGKDLAQHRRSSSSHECYNINRNAQTDLPYKESLSRKRSAPSPIDRTQPKPILRGYQYSPEQFSGRERETKKVIFSGSTEVRELTRQMDQRLNSREQRLVRSRSPVAPNRPSHPPPPPPPPPSRRHSVNINQTTFTNLPRGMNVLSDVRNTSSPWHLGANNNITSSQGFTSSTYMQPLANGKSNQWPRHVQTLNRSHFQKEDVCKMTRFNQESGDKFIQALKDSQNLKTDSVNGHYDNNTILSQGRSGKVHSKPQSDDSNTNTTDNTEVPKNDDDFGTEILHRDKLRRSKFKKQRTPALRVAMYICRLNGRTHPMGNKINSFNKAILKRQQGDGKVNIEKTLEQVRRFMDGVKKHLLTEKIDVMTRKFRGQIAENGAKGESVDISEDELNERLDVICENCLHNIILRPIYDHLIKQIRYYLNKNKDLEKISVNIDKGVSKSPVYLGVRENLIPPDEGTRREVTEIFTQLAGVHSPIRKLELLLDAVKLVYKSIRDKKHPNKTDLSLGADDFLPIFIYTLIHTGVKEIEVEFLYTWNLVDQNLLSGEGGYYLTTLCTAIEVLKQADFNSKDQDSEVLCVVEI